MPDPAERRRGLLCYLGRTDVLLALLVIGIGAASLALVWDYRLGTNRNMGPGYWPRVVSYLLILLGVLLILGSAAARASVIELPRPRSFVLVLAAVLIFAATIESLGLIVAAALTVVTAALADATGRWREIAALTIGLTVFAALLFVELLGLSMRLVPPGLL